MSYKIQDKICAFPILFHLKSSHCKVDIWSNDFDSSITPLRTVSSCMTISKRSKTESEGCSIFRGFITDNLDDSNIKTISTGKSVLCISRSSSGIREKDACPIHRLNQIRQKKIEIYIYNSLITSVKLLK